MIATISPRSIEIVTPLSANTSMVPIRYTLVTSVSSIMSPTFVWPPYLLSTAARSASAGSEAPPSESSPDEAAQRGESSLRRGRLGLHHD